MRLIDADAAIELLRRLGSRDYRRKEGTLADAMKMLGHSTYTPTIEAEPVKHGRWVMDDYTERYRCSLCEAYQPYDVVADYIDYWDCDYCPNCGAKIDKEDNDERQAD